MRTLKIAFLIFPIILLLNSCGAGSSDSAVNNESASSEEAQPVDLCRCLTDPGDSPYLKENEKACRDAISKELGVENWEAVNMSQHPDISAKFDALAARCTGDTTTSTAAAPDDQDNQESTIFEYIGTENGYVWETIDNNAQIYTTLAFDKSIFRNAAYLMNGSTDSKDFKKAIEFNGTWSATGDHRVDGVISANNVNVNWTFSDDFSTLINNKGVTYRRVKVK